MNVEGLPVIMDEPVAVSKQDFVRAARNKQAIEFIRSVRLMRSAQLPAVKLVEHLAETDEEFRRLEQCSSDFLRVIPHEWCLVPRSRIPHKKQPISETGVKGRRSMLPYGYILAARVPILDMVPESKERTKQMPGNLSTVTLAQAAFGIYMNDGDKVLGYQQPDHTVFATIRGQEPQSPKATYPDIEPILLSRVNS